MVEDKKSTKKKAVKTVRVNPEDWKQAEKILDTLGINMPTAITLFVRYIILRKGLPFPINLPEGGEDIYTSFRSSSDTGSLNAKETEGRLEDLENREEKDESLSWQQEEDIGHMKQELPDFEDSDAEEFEDRILRNGEYSLEYPETVSTQYSLPNEEQVESEAAPVEYEVSPDLSDLESFEQYYQEFLKQKGAVSQKETAYTKKEAVKEDSVHIKPHFGDLFSLPI